MKKALLMAVVIGLSAGVSACGQWKVSALKEKKLCAIPNASAPGGVMMDFDESGTFNQSFSIRVFDGRIYTADNLLKRLQVLNREGEPLLMIGPRMSREDAGDVKQSTFNFSVIGALAVDSRGSIYVQNRLMPSGGAMRSERGDEIDFSPSYILVFDKSGGLMHTIGQKGSPDIPFYYIEDIQIDRSDRLFVVSRTFDTWSVFRFDNRKRDFFISLGVSDFRETEKGESYTGRIENIKAFASGEDFLVSVAYYHGSRFKYRKIYDYSLEKGRKDERSVITIPDPKNELFNLVDDKHLFLWNVEGGKIKFAILNLDGNVINNVLVQMRDNKFYEEVFADETGQLYSAHVNKKEVEVMEWK
ncbi:MAG TPA: hypothetical protein PKO25_09815 [Spirochaetota bacterium]|nr:hypothetical protein [Spirochaetota bacterium]OPZ38715.1 MAG: hypothetical protein BWY96_00821 [Spirochaetes bacterium ADurb.BinA120]HNU92156.1 hypothetical protein [Spirochaetota bacterium]HPI13674.1 hypothetical protein [Spirochaetota bacterium]HPO46649.1 hypothetical protein [Spirochaetota bacterium]